MCVWSCTSTLPCFSRCAVKLSKENTSSSLKKAVEENRKNGVRMCTANVISLLDLSYEGRCDGTICGIPPVEHVE
jgi:hypothetical protein